MLKLPIRSTLAKTFAVMALPAFVLTACVNNEADDTKTEAEEKETKEKKEKAKVAAYNDSIANYNDRKDQDTANSKVSTSGYYAMIANENDRLGIDYNYTTQTLDSLILALQATSNRANYNFQQDMGLIGAQVTNMKNDKKALNTSQSLKTTFTNVVNSFRRIQEQKYPDLKDRVDDVEEKVMALDATKPAKDQKNVIKKIFGEMEDLIREMNEERMERIEEAMED